MKHNRRLCGVAVVLLLAGCGYQDDMQQHRTQLAQLRDDYGSLQDRLKLAEEVNGSLQARLDEMERNLEEAKAQLEAPRKSFDTARQELQRAFSELAESSRGEFTAAQDALTQSTEGFGKRIAELEQRWNAFAEGYDPEVRNELQQNAAAANETGKSLTALKDQGILTVEALEKTAAQAGQLRDLIQEHARQAADSDLVGKLQASLQAAEKELAALKTDLAVVTTLKSSVDNQTQALQQIQTDIAAGSNKSASRWNSLETTVRGLGNKTHTIETTLQRVESKVRQVESNVRRFR